MNDEEQTFTFVDKRGKASDAPDAAPAEAAVPPPAGAAFPMDTPPADIAFDEAEDTAGREDAEGGQPEIDVYSLLAYCVSLLEAQAWQCLGLIADPQTGDANPDMAQAKVAIDAVGDLAKYLDNAPPDAVPDDLRRDLRTLVSNLRLNFVGQQNRPV